ncbi:conserved membrane hypothetical protein [Candidatus Sulfopaludibacter sp. SbA4]|nr:conserved membrane hypothetical protein [Candidatus Sulfopaludibacter sp. SbA4]
MNLTGGAYPEQVAGARVSADFFRLFGAPVLQGRTFTAEEDRPNGGQAAVLSHALWVRRFGSNLQIIGKTISLNGAPYVVIGILGAGFAPDVFDQPPDVWVPFPIAPDNTEGGCYCTVTGRLRPGVTLGMAMAHLQLVADRYRSAFPQRMGPKQGFAIQSLRESIVGDVRQSLMILVGAVSFVLLIACANVANLLLVRAIGRKREMAIRAAVGASRGRIVRQVLTECVALSFTGGALGVTLGLAGIRALLALYPSNPLLAPVGVIRIPRVGESGSAITLDWRILAFTVLVSLATGVVFGLMPAVQAARADLSGMLKESSGRSGTGLRQTRTRSLLVIVEVALALILLIGAMLLIRTSIALRAVDPGFDSRNALILQMSLAGPRFEKTVEIDRLVRDGVERVRSLPGVAAVASACCVPLETVWQLSFVVAGRPLDRAFHGFAGWTFISPEYFDAFRIPVVRGRAFTERDDAGAPGVVIINQAMARQYWPSGDPLNDRLIIGRYVRPEYEKDSARQIVGIVGDIRDVGLSRNPRPAMYVPMAQLPDAVNALNLRLLPIAWIVRTGGEPHSLRAAIQNELRQATGLPVARVRAMDEVAAQSTARTQLNMLLMTIFGCSALVLAAIGIYGLMAYSVQQRRQEVGIRMALGAESRNVRFMVVVQGMYLAAIGMAIGIAAAFGLTRFLASFLYGVKPRDPLVFAGVPALLTAVALFAVWLPARRASRIDPADALRHD